MATLAELQAELALYETARNNALQAQSYGIAGRNKTMAALNDLQAQIESLRSRISRLTTPGSSTIAPIFIPGGD
jgi:hypothetical protein